MIDIIDTYTSDCNDAIQFKDNLVENYVDLDLSRFSIDLWNVNKLVEEKHLRTNNHVKEYNPGRRFRPPDPAGKHWK